MANNRRMTNTEILTEIAQMNDAEMTANGVASELRDTAREGVARGDVNGFMATRIGTYSPLYNAFVGFVSKIVHQSITKATYHDKWARHRRGLIPGGDLELAFVKLGTEGDGNDSALINGYFPSSPRSVTSTVEASVPDTIHAYDRTPFNFVARVPVGKKNLKDAFTSEYGINDLIDKTRESALRDYIQFQINTNIGLKLSEPLQGTSSLYADTTSPAAATVTGRARFHALTRVETTLAGKINFNDWSDAELMNVYTSLKQIAYRMTGDPSSTYNVYGAQNNVEDLGKLVVYINSDLWSVLTTRINSAAFNVTELKDAGLKIVPMMAEFIDSMTTSAGAIPAGYKGDLANARAKCVGFIADEKYVEEWTVADDTCVTPAERDEILTRYYDGLITRRDYACNCYLVVGCPAS